MNSDHRVPAPGSGRVSPIHYRVVDAEVEGRLNVSHLPASRGPVKESHHQVAGHTAQQGDKEKQKYVFIKFNGSLLFWFHDLAKVVLGRILIAPNLLDHKIQDLSSCLSIVEQILEYRLPESIP